MASLTNFGSDVIERTLEKDIAQESTQNLEEVYEVSRCVRWIQDGGYKKVGLQFPDELIVDAPAVARALSTALGFKVYILGDTTYGSCCVDEVAAEHVGADSIVHFGRSCLSPSRRLPVLYIFTRLSVNLPLVVESLQAAIQEADTRLVLVYDTRCHHAAGEAARILQDKFPKLVPSTLLLNRLYSPCSLSSNDKTPLENHTCSNGIDINGEEEKGKSNDFMFCGRSVCLPDGEEIKDYHFIYLGPRGPTVTCLCMKFSESTFYCADPSSGEVTVTSGLRSVMSRSNKLEMVKDAEIIGILVGTLGVADYREIISRLKAVVRAAGKRSYTFVVGKPNEPKLANISEVDVFAYVACPETSIVERSVDPALYRKLVTPWELEVALLNQQEWDLHFEADFRQLLPGGLRHVVAAGERREEEVNVSLITNRAQRLGMRDDEEPTLDSITGAVQVRDNLTLASLHVGGGGQALKGRTWQGLDPNMNPPSATGTVVEGRKGIAAGYQDETPAES
ncbi:putative diphthamide biosynthesis protein 2-like [Penaeus vannamei]|uniref:2-(3-amino-3-carboxypropyl)histidine synthase subunit 2 n=1 Tax=Penaeus vannamei TaxID=6689 RepID=A0A423SL61_PENVA|nr:2-(3-amino-3-carboxypropyl)histidine synthase subunit 2-like [Penaeus vannamei]XP_027229280.1 2-(3-amino-3-carboxypropyl)histidine synthase subunit 2-like [Penaeus vannamei]ROT64884.1 putative diphthamide biosynthesis protein 2-like [Penaeus vannamei]